jgi:hypothetical protein
MKNLVLIGVLTILGIIGLSSCQSDGNVTTPSTQESAGTYSDAFSDIFTLPTDFTDYFCLNEGSLDQSLSLGFSPVGCIDSADTNKGHKLPNHGDMGKGMGHHGDKKDTTHHNGNTGDTAKHGGMGDMGNGRDKGRGIDIGRALHQLKLILTAEQITMVQDAVKAYHDCMNSVMEPIKLQRDAVIADANLQRKVIIDAYKAGTIDKATAKQQLQDLNSATKAALDLIKPDPTAGCSCLYTLLDSIGGNAAHGIPSIFSTPEQQTTWDAWVVTLTGICFPRP